MAKKGRLQVKLRSSESAYMYVTTKNPKKHPERMELRKYDPTLKKHTTFKEEK